MIHVTGATGYLGSELVRRIGGEHPRVEVRDGEAVRRLFEERRPSAVIHTAYRQDDASVNAEGAAVVAAAAAAVGARLVHVSTDRVFDGTKGAPYTEDDEPRPLDDYGRSKLAAERSVLELHPDALVVRTSLLVGAREPGRQEREILAGARGEHELPFFADEWRSPILVSDFAAALLELADSEARGVLHVAGADRLSRYELARLVAAAHGLPDTRLRRGTIAESGLTRAADCTLDSSRARALLRTPLPGVVSRIGREWTSGSGG